MSFSSHAYFPLGMSNRCVDLVVGAYFRVAFGFLRLRGLGSWIGSLEEANSSAIYT